MRNNENLNTRTDIPAGNYLPIPVFTRFIMKKLSYTLGTMAFFLSLGSAVHAGKPAQKPNIIIILADDMGYSDIGCYGSEINTPNLDSLAKEGIRFSQFYNNARSCPTRASLLTGLYPHQTGIGHMTNDPESPAAFKLAELPGYQGNLNRKCMTIAEVLKTGGYHTILSGKWHVGMHQEEDKPLQRGFDKFYGLLSGGTNYFHPETLKGRHLTEGTTNISTGENFYLTDALTDKAIEYLRDKPEDKPFFLYLAYTAPHWPLQAPLENIAKYRGKYLKDWKDFRKNRLEKMKAIGLVPENTELSEANTQDWESLSDKKKDEMDLRMAIYAAQIDRMDENIGRLIKHLKETKQLENIFILFLSDNGACEEGGMLGGGKTENLLTHVGWVLSYGKVWANVSNTPFKEYKHWVHEGGIRTPAIVYWKQGIPENKENSVLNQYAFINDIMATAIDLGQAEYPKAYKGNDIYPLEGKSMVPALKNPDLPIHDTPIFWEHEGNRAVRQGKWKIVSKFDAGKNDFGPWELYDIDSDASELNNLVSQQKDRTAQMAESYENWARAKNVADWQEILEIMKNQH